MKDRNRIMVAIDRSSMANEALKRAIFIAKEKKAQLIVIHIMESSFISSPFVESMDAKKTEKEIKLQVEKLISKEDIEYILFVESGSPSSSISLKIQNLKLDLLIIGTHGKNDISSKYFGSTTEKLIQKVGIPVLIVKNEVRYDYKKMLAPTDMSKYSKESILFAYIFFHTASLKYIHVDEEVDGVASVTQRISTDKEGKTNKQLLTEAYITLEKFVKETAKGEMFVLENKASINEDLLAYINKDESDLLILGSKGVDNLNSFLFGSTAAYLLKNSSMDVLAYVPR